MNDPEKPEKKPEKKPGDGKPADGGPSGEQPAGEKPAAKLDPAKCHLAQQWKLNAPVVACRWHPQGKYVFAGVQDRTVRRLEVPSGAETILEGHDSWVRGLALHPDGNTLYSGGYDGRLIFWPALEEKPKPLRTIEAHKGWVRAVQISPDGKRLVSVGVDQKVKLWSTEDGSQLAEYTGHDAQVFHAAFHPTENHLATIDQQAVVKHWDLGDGKLLREMKLEELHKFDTTFQAHLGGARGMRFSPDGKSLACGGITNVTNAFAGIGNPAVGVLDWESGKKRLLHTPKAKYNASTWGVDYHADGFLATGVGGGGGGFVVFYRLDSAADFHQFKLPSSCRDLHLSPDGALLALACADNHVRLCDLRPKA